MIEVKLEDFFNVSDFETKKKKLQKVSKDGVSLRVGIKIEGGKAVPDVRFDETGTPGEEDAGKA